MVEVMVLTEEKKLVGNWAAFPVAMRTVMVSPIARPIPSFDCRSTGV